MSEVHGIVYAYRSSARLGELSEVFIIKDFDIVD